MSDPTDSADNPSRRRLRLVSMRGLIRLVLFVGLLPAVGLVSGGLWPFGLLNHFQAQYAGFLLLCLAGFLLARRLKPALLTLACLVLPAARLAPLFLPQEQAMAAGPTLRIATFNVLTSNTRHADTVAWIREADPDLVFLPETNDRWNEALAPLMDRWPHRIGRPREGNFGYTLLSKHPFEVVSAFELGGNGLVGIPLMTVVIRSPAGPITVVGVHPPPPVRSSWCGERDLYLRRVAGIARETEEPILVVGDFNATRWSQAMRPLFQAGLRDTAEGHGFNATWHRRNPLVAIPIDHVLARGFGPVLTHQVGPDLGSDHRPVIVELAVE